MVKRGSTVRVRQRLCLIPADAGLFQLDAGGRTRLTKHKVGTREEWLAARTAFLLERPGT
jgi:hypothetical protein